MQGGWGVPCVPAHEPYFYLVCHHRRYLNPANISQTPRTHGKPHSEPAPARPRVIDLSWRLVGGWPFGLVNDSNLAAIPNPKPQGITAGYPPLI